MLRHTKIYLDYFGYGEQDFIPCEICGLRAVDIHHIYGRGKGKDVIENLMALCRDHHIACHEKRLSKMMSKSIHDLFISKLD